MNSIAKGNGELGISDPVSGVDALPIIRRLVLEFLLFLAEKLKDNHAFSQGERRNTRKIACPGATHSNQPDELIGRYVLMSGC